MHEQGQVTVREPLGPARLVGAAESNIVAEQDQTIYSVQHGGGEVHSGTLTRARELCPAMAALPLAASRAAMELMSIGQNVMAEKAQKSARATNETAERSRPASLDAILDRQTKAKPMATEKPRPSGPPEKRLAVPDKASVAEHLDAVTPAAPVELLAAHESIAMHTQPAPRVSEVVQEPKPTAVLQVKIQSVAPPAIASEKTMPVPVVVPITAPRAPEQAPAREVSAAVVEPVAQQKLPFIEQPAPMVALSMPVEVAMPNFLPPKPVERPADTIEILPAVDLPQEAPHSEPAIGFSENLEPLTIQEIINVAEELDTFSGAYLFENTATVFPQQEFVVFDIPVADAEADDNFVGYTLPLPVSAPVSATHAPTAETVVPIRPAVEASLPPLPVEQLSAPALHETAASETASLAPVPIVESFAQAIKTVEASPVPTAPIVKEIAVQLHELPKTQQPAVEIILTEISGLAAELQQLPVEMPLAAAEMVIEKIEELCAELLAALVIKPTPKAISALRALLLSPKVAQSLAPPVAALPDTIGTHERKHGWLGQQHSDSGSDPATYLSQLMGNSALTAYAPA